MRRYPSRLRELAAARLDPLSDRLLARLMRRRLRRAAAIQARRSAPGPSDWSDELVDAQEALIRRYAQGRSFADIGCMWGVDGACAFLAEAAGATRVTAMDKWPRTEKYLATERELGSSVGFVQGDLHTESIAEEVGVHDVVWCSGLLYHTPHLGMAIGNLLRMTGRYLIVGTKGIPAIPGLPGAGVFYPGLDPDQRAVYEPVSEPVANEPFDRERYFANWFWGLSPEALLALVRSKADVKLVEQVDLPWGKRFDNVYLVLERVDGPAQGG